MAGARRRAAGGRKARPIDARSLGEALSYPGIDPRTWISYATVDGDPVDHDDELGYLIPITLQPSQVQQTAVVGQQIAGDGEGEHWPFVEGDTVLVAIPHGMERGGPVIFCRLSNARAKPPKIVAGQLAGKNNLSYRKTRTARLEEYGDRWTVRSAVSEALISIETTGTITLRDGGKGALQLSSDAFAYQGGNPDIPGQLCVLQFDLPAVRATIAAGEAQLTLSSIASTPSFPLSSNSLLSVPSNLQISSGGNLAAEHAASAESVANFLLQFETLFLTAMGTAFGAMGTPLGASLGAFGAGFTTAWTTAMSTAFAAFVSSLPTTIAGAASTAAVTPQIPAVASAIFAAFLAQPPKVTPGVPGVGQPTPGLGAAATLIG